MAISEDFKQALDELWELHQKKNKDYGAATDPYRNVRGSEEWGIEPWIGALIRGTDKIKRLQKYAKTGELSNEGAEDSLMDLAVYSIIALVLWREQNPKTTFNMNSITNSSSYTITGKRTFESYPENCTCDSGLLCPVHAITNDAR